MKKLFGFIAALCVLSMLSGGGFPAFMGGGSSDSDLGFIDDGEVVARLKSSPDRNGNVATITVYYDRIEWERTGTSTMFSPNQATVMMNDIKKLNSWGTNFPHSYS